MIDIIYNSVAQRPVIMMYHVHVRCMVLVLDHILMLRSVFQGWRIWSDKLRSILRLLAFAFFFRLHSVSLCKCILRIKLSLLYKEAESFLKTIPVCSSLSHFKPFYLLNCTNFCPLFPSSSHENIRSYFTRY